MIVFPQLQRNIQKLLFHSYNHISLEVYSMYTYQATTHETLEWPYCRICQVKSLSVVRVRTIKAEELPQLAPPLC